MAISTRSSVVAVYRNRSDAESAAKDLRNNGFDSGDIYVGSYNDAGTGTTREWNATHHHEGGIKGWFKSLFGHDDDSSDYNYYEDAVTTGGVIVSVQAPEQQVDRAVDILQKYNPLDIDQNAARANTAAQTAAAGSATRGPETAASRSNVQGRQARGTSDLPKTIPVVEEDVRVGKRAVVRGGVRVYTRVVEQPVEQAVNLREERVRVDRQPANRPVQGGELRAGTDQVIEVQEFAEEPVVQKQARVVEEVRVSKDVDERSQTIRDTVRRQEVEVEDLGKGNRTAAATGSTESYTDDFRNDFRTRYGSSGASYEDYEPAYTYGYTAANDPRYQGRSWDEVESDLRNDYGRRYPNSTWERMKDAIRYGWDKVTGKARGATTSNR
jgi:stress response protein YsnF